jgi:hypothetical protein
MGRVRENDAIVGRIGATDHKVGIAKTPLDHAAVELAQPLALHVQHEPGRRRRPTQDRDRLRVVEHVDNVELAPDDVLSDPGPEAPQVDRRREERPSGREEIAVDRLEDAAVPWRRGRASVER